MNLKVHQIYFGAWQRPQLDPAFTPYDNSACPNPDWREFYVFRQAYLAGETKKFDYTGYLSWKFGEKTGLSGADFVRFCEQNPGHDVYFVNPFPLSIYLGNVWNHGERHHPGITALAQEILDGAGYKISLKKLPANLRTNAFCNFWVGNAKFWDRYMEFCLPIWDYIENGLPEVLRQKLFKRADRTIKASFFSFVFERLFTTFLLTHPEIKSLSYTYTEGQLARAHSEHEIPLVLEAQRLEAAYPDDLEPIRRNPLLISGLHYYHAWKWDRRFLAELFYHSAQVLWHLVPFRMHLLRSDALKRSTRKLMRRLRPDMKSPLGRDLAR